MTRRVIELDPMDRIEIIRKQLERKDSLEKRIAWDERNIEIPMPPIPKYQPIPKSKKSPGLWNFVKSIMP